MSTKIYLAGDIDKNDRWRPKVIRACPRPAWFFSPVDNVVDYKYSQLKKANENNRVFLHCDFHKIDKSDIVFAYVRSCESRHSGTSAEIGYARAKNKLILYVNDMPKKERYLYEFIERAADEVFDSLSAGIEYLKDYIEEMVYDPEFPDYGDEVEK